MSVFDKPHPDGVFAASCFMHETSVSVVIEGQSYSPIVIDWFFQNGELDQYHKLIESCPQEDSENLQLPCNDYHPCQVDFMTTSSSDPHPLTKLQFDA
eukprot:423421-Ditylum_brightwellii.AAC.1